MNYYLNGIVLIFFGATLILINAYFFFQDYKWKFLKSSIRKAYYLLPNIVVLFLSIVTVVEGVIYLFIVNNQLA